MRELRRAGFGDDDIGIAVPEPGRYIVDDDRERELLTGVTEGIAEGAPVGAIAGMLLMTLAVPDAGAAIGVAGALFVGGIGGAIWGSFLGAMSGFTAKVKLDDYGDRECEIPLAGADVLVVVNAGDRASEARDLMQQQGAKCFLDEAHKSR
jgi:hypothetical protein